MPRTKADQLPGEVKYRPPAGTPKDRMLARATGKTEKGEKVAARKPPPKVSKVA